MKHDNYLQKILNFLRRKFLKCRIIQGSFGRERREGKKIETNGSTLERNSGYWEDFLALKYPNLRSHSVLNVLK